MKYLSIGLAALLLAAPLAQAADNPDVLRLSQPLPVLIAGSIPGDHAIDCGETLAMRKTFCRRAS